MVSEKNANVYCRRLEPVYEFIMSSVHATSAIGFAHDALSLDMTQKLSQTNAQRRLLCGAVVVRLRKTQWTTLGIDGNMHAVICRNACRPR